MVKVFVKKGSQSEQLICAECDEVGGVEEVEVYRQSDCDLKFEDNDSHYFEDSGSLVTVWYCEHCCEYTANQPSTQENALYVCGACNYSYQSEYDAINCCNER
jgi:hypothetical protein